MRRLIAHPICIGAMACLATTSCGVASVNQPRETAPYPVQQNLEVEHNADRLYEAIWGSATQKEAGHYLAFRSMNDPVKACMHDLRIPYDATFQRIWTGYEANGTSSQWMGAFWRAPSDRALATAEAIRNEVDPPPLSGVESTERYWRGLQECADQEGDPVGAGRPKGIEPLSSQFEAMIVNVEDQLTPIDLYTSCMSEHGIDMSGGGVEGWQGLYLFLTDKMPLPPLPDEDPSQEWTHYLGLEHAALSADAACRGDQYRTGLAMLGPMLDEFEVAHAEELQSVQTQWDQILAEARDLGFDQ